MIRLKVDSSDIVIVDNSTFVETRAKLSVLESVSQHSILEMTTSILLERIELEYELEYLELVQGHSYPRAVTKIQTEIDTERMRATRSDFLESMKSHIKVRVLDRIRYELGSYCTEEIEE